MTPDLPELDSLERLRREIESVDRSIVLLLAARMDAAHRTLRVRVAHDHRLTDRGQERRVLERSRAWADELGLSRECVEHLFQSLIEEGKARFRSAEGHRESPVVTVLLADPTGPVVRLGRTPHPELVAVPSPR